MRRAFERRVDQQATAALPVIQGSSDDFLQECDDRIPRGKAELKTANALAEGVRLSPKALYKLAPAMPISSAKSRTEVAS